VARSSLPAFAPPLSFGGALALHATTLPENGLRLFVLPDPSAPVVSYQTWLKVGSRDESPGKTGISHLLEHLMFLGTKRHPLGEFDRLIELAGGENNASTWTDWTQYHENVPASELDLVIALEVDRFETLGVSEAKFQSERDVVVSERRDRVEDDVDGAASERLFAMVFGRRHPYGWPTLGWMQDIQGLTRADARSYFRQHYAPNHAAIVWRATSIRATSCAACTAPTAASRRGPAPRRPGLRSAR
jgi:zinc protease